MLATTESMVAELGKATAPHIGKLLSRLGRAQFDKFVATSTNVFADHLRDTVARCSTTKNVLYRDPVSLLSQYVTTNFIAQQSTISDGRLLKHAQSAGINCLITGLAGSGKSMFMKWMAVNLADTILNHQRIPLYIEARNLGNHALTSTIEVALFDSTSSEKSNATFDQFKIGLEHGVFISIIDGLDEISPEYRDGFLREISEFRRRFPNTPIICSSRPERQIESLADLQVLRIAGMELHQVKEVIHNLVFDEEKKRGFVNELESGLFDDHRSFLSNPLLAIIMLIMFDNNSNVPRKLTAFYSQVFEALFFRHDSSKGIYTRKHFANLEIDQFDEVFRSFSFETYAMGKIRFPATDLTGLIRASLNRSGLQNVKPDLYIKDCKQSVCLMQEDGLESAFVHRSFQEYFAARYLLYYKGDVFSKVLDRLALRADTDNVLPMLYEMNAIEVKRLWIINRLTDFSRSLDSLDVSDPAAVCKFIISHVEAVEVDKRTTEVVAVFFKTDARPIDAALSLLAREFNEAGVHILSGKLFGGMGDTIGNFLSSPAVAEAELRKTITGLLKSHENKNPRVYFWEDSVAWMQLSNLSEMLLRLRDRIAELAKSVEQQTSANDDFAADILKIMTA
ncbi:MAG TPA: NACHT domain-containing protein [Allosphingosinicella sp.]|nr:NACHT domain-containing protein [Allosphingosinicella sp.]